MKPKNLQFFAPCPRGLESTLATELNKIGASAVQSSNGGVHFQGDWRTCYRANLGSRVASRILWQISDQSYRNEDNIYQTAFALPWNEWFSAQHTIRVNLAAIKCPLRSLDFVTLKIKDAICDKFLHLNSAI
jgi:putative N6-adenine-specific DNA methylase